MGEEGRRVHVTGNGVIVRGTIIHARGFTTPGDTTEPTGISVACSKEEKVALMKALAKSLGYVVGKVED